MAVDLFANLAQTVISAGGTTAPAQGTTELWTPANPGAFPTASPAASPPTQFRITDPALPSERIRVTDSRTVPWTVVRGDEGTTPVPHLAGFTVEAVITAGALAEFVQSGGGTMTGPLILEGSPASQVPAGAANGKIWTSDNSGNGSWQAPPAGGINPPAGDIGGTTSAPTVLSTHLTNPLPVSQGGTGAASVSPNQVFSGPSSGGAAPPSYRALAAADIPQLTDYAPTGKPGATAASDWVGATISGPPQSGTFSTGNWVLAQDGSVWVCTAGGSPGTWKQAGDLPSDFRPEAYGTTGWAYSLSDAAVTTGTAVVTSPSNGFANAVAGDVIYIVGAGAAGADYSGTIASVQNAGQVTLSANAGTTVSGKGCVYHAESGPAILAAYQAAHAYALASPERRARVILSKLYGTAMAPTKGGIATEGNAIIPLTIVNPATTAKIRIEFAGEGTTDAAELPHWLQPAPQLSGPGIVCTSLAGTSDMTYGPSSVIGGPYYQYGGATSTFSNMAVVLSGFRIHVPFNSTYCGFDFYGIAEDYETGFSCQAMGIVPSGGAWPQLNQAAITNQYTFGGRKGDTNNNARQDMSQCSCEGLAYGYMISEHTTWDTIRTIYCIIGMEAYGGSATAHGFKGGHLCAEACAWAVGAYRVAPLDNSVKGTIDHVDMEIPGQQLIYDPGNLMAGWIGVMGNYTPGYGIITVSGAQGVRVVELMQPAGPIASPQAPPASGSQWINEYYSDLWVTLSVSGGNITGVVLYGPQGSGTGVTQVIPASATIVSFWLPAGCAYKPTYTGILTHDLTAKGGL